jgi:glycosyltransferase involved in cell wall biosynthesis
MKTRAGGKAPKILFIPLEFLTWGMARHFSHGFSLGFEDGFKAHGLDFLTLPALCSRSTGMHDDSRSYWLDRARALCRGMDFDQVWVEVVHSHLDDDLLEWISGLAPVRVALVGESLEYEVQVKAEAPHLLARKSLVEKRLAAFTHCLAADEKDADSLSRGNSVKTMWWASVVSERFIGKVWNPHAEPRAIFAGSVYGERKSWLSDPALMRLLVHQSIPPEEAAFAARFDELHARLTGYLDAGAEATWEKVSGYLTPLRHIRQENFANWIKSLANGVAVVNLPSFFHGYAGRVVEAMAAGRPVVSWQVPSRPRNLALFEDGKDILLFRGDDRGKLREHLERLVAEPDYGRRIAANATRKLWLFHTMEKRIGQVLEWIETDREPDYREAIPETDLDRSFATFEAGFSGLQDGADKAPVASDVAEKVRLAESMLASGDRSGAIFLLESIPENAPGTQALDKVLAELHFAEKDFKTAAFRYMRAIQVESRNLSLWLGCARACSCMGNIEMTRAALEGALAVAPGHAEASSLLASLPR